MRGSAQVWLLALASVEASAQVLELGWESAQVWTQVLALGRCLGCRLQGVARRQDPSRQRKAVGTLSGVFRFDPLSEIDC